MKIERAEFTCRRGGVMQMTSTVSLRVRPWWLLASELVRFFWRQTCAGFDLRSCFGNTWRLYRAALEARKACRIVRKP